MADPRRAFREQVLAALGASSDVQRAVLRYTEPMAPTDDRIRLPLPDEPHLTAWSAYRDEAIARGGYETLRTHFVQLLFPVASGISDDAAYLRATRRGQRDAALEERFGSGLGIVDPDGIQIEVVDGAGGRAPVVTVRDRTDFVALVRAFTERNEPVPVPAAMGACLVKGLNNWSRVADHRSRWERDHPGADAAAWHEEFRRFAEDKSGYQDKFVLLSTGPYSGIAADELAIDPSVWLRQSHTIRREHELTHYLTSRVFGVVRSHLHDELVADFAGLRAAFGRYDRALALRALGLQPDASVRPGGRFEVYQSALPAAGGALVRHLAVRSTEGLERIDRRVGTPATASDQARLSLALFALSLEELASDRAPDMAADLLP